MESTINHFVIKAVTQIYSGLVRFYPAQFKNEYAKEMIELFDDLCQETWQQQGYMGLTKLGLLIVKDFSTSAAHEYLDFWRHKMRQKQSLFQIIGIILLVYTGLFIVLNVLIYEVGLPISWNPYAALHGRASTPFQSTLFDMSILFSPIIALVLFFIPSINIAFNPGNNQLATMSISKLNRGSMILLSFCILALAILGIYFMVENLPCLIGQQLSC